MYYAEDHFTHYATKCTLNMELQLITVLPPNACTVHNFVAFTLCIFYMYAENILGVHLKKLMCDVFRMVAKAADGFEMLL